VSKSGVTLHNAELTKRKTRHVDDIKPYTAHQSTTPSSSKTSSHTKSKHSTFYTIPLQTVENNSPAPEILPLDPGADADNRQNGDELNEHAPTSTESSIAQRIAKRRRPTSPRRSIGERVKRRLKQK
jgi:hypothetical protein